MSGETITATVEICVQVGIDDYRLKRYSRNFDASITLADIISWAKSMGVENPGINDVIFSDFTGSSF